MSRHLFLVFLICLADLPSPASAQSPDPTPSSDFSTQFEGMRESVNSGVFKLTDRIDDFFDNSRTEEQRKTDYFRVGGAVRFRTGEPIRLRQRFRAGINLDTISERLRLVAGGFSGDRVEDGETLEDEVDTRDFTDLT